MPALSVLKQTPATARPDAPVDMGLSEDIAAQNERLALLAHLQGMVEAEDSKPLSPLERIDELLREVTWLQRKYRDAEPPVAERINARLAAITVELRALKADTGQTVTCWFDPADLIATER
jgi:hypothetical protein